MLIGICAYLIILIGIAAWVGRRVQKADDFLVADRKLNTGLLFSTLLAANIGAGSTVGATGLGFQYGLAAWWWVGSAGIGSLLLAYLVGPKIWQLAKDNHFFTVGDYLAWRYNEKVKLLISITLSLGSLALLAAQLLAIAFILETVANIPTQLGTSFAGIIVIVYFMFGGLLSSCYVNVLQLVILLSGFLITLPIALHNSGGWHNLPLHSHHDWHAISSWIILLAPAFIVSPGLLQKVYGAKDIQTAKVSTKLNALCLLLFAFIPAILGLVARSQFPELTQTELALPMVMKNLLPSWLSAYALAAVLSAELSSCDAILFMLTTALSNDIYKTFSKSGATSAQLLKHNRITAIVAGCLGILIALYIASIIAALSVFYSLLTVALTIPLLTGLYQKHVSSNATLMIIVTSLVCTIAIKFGHSDQLLGLSATSWGISTSLMLWLYYRTRRNK